MFASTTHGDFIQPGNIIGGARKEVRTNSRERVRVSKVLLLLLLVSKHKIARVDTSIFDYAI